MLFSPFPLFGQSQAAPPPPEPMPITPANQTFRAGILPVLLHVPINIDAPNTDILNGEQELIAECIFNFMNEHLRFAGVEITKTKSGIEDVICRCFVVGKDTPITRATDSDIVGAAAETRSLDFLGLKIIPGLPFTPVNSGNICNPRVLRNYAFQLTLSNSTGDDVVGANGSCFVNMKFVPEKSVVKITA